LGWGVPLTKKQHRKTSGARLSITWKKGGALKRKDSLKPLSCNIKKRNNPDYREAEIQLALVEKKITHPAPRISTQDEKTSPGSPDIAAHKAREPIPVFPNPLTEKSKIETPKQEDLPSPEEVGRVLFPQFYTESHPPEEDEKDLQRYIERKKKSMDNYSFHMDKARMYREHKLYNTAILEYKDALKAKPESFDALTELSELYLLMENTERAEQIFSNAEQYFREDPRFYLKWGNIYLAQSELRKAQNKYKKSLELSPDYTAAINNLGIIELRNRNYTKAAGFFESVLEIDPDFISAHLNLGIIYDDYLKDPAKAKKHYEAYLKAGGNRKQEVRKWLEEMEP